MTKKKIEKKVTRKKECNITPSDWVVYLQGEISTLIGFILPILTAYLLIVIAVTQLSLILGDDPIFETTLSISVSLFALLIIIIIATGLVIKPERELCKRIIKGELTKHKDILKEYDKIKADLKIFKKRRK